MADRSFLSWPFFTDEHRTLANDLDEWAANVVVPILELEDTDAICRELVSRLGQSGWLRYVVPAEVGGLYENLDVRSICIARETLARYSGLADFAFAMQGLGSGPISLFGSAKMKDEYLAPVSAGTAIAAFALSEEAAGSNVAALATTATRDGGHYILNGAKTWISNAGLADFYVVFARTGDDDGTKGLSAFVVDAGTDGLDVSERIDVISPHPIGSLVLEDCLVPAAQMVGVSGEGFKIAMSTLDVFRPSVGAAALGFARRALDEAVERACDRVIFDRPLSGYQMTQQKLAEMATDIDASALLVYRAAWCKDRGDDRITREAAMAKLFSTEMAQRVIDHAVQIFGGLGVVTGMPVEELYRDIRPLRIYEGTSEIQKLIIARELLRKP